MNTLLQRLAVLGAILSLPFVGGCNKSPGTPTVGGAVGATATTVDFVICGATIDSLFSFEVLVREVRLERLDGSLSDNLLGGPVPLELLHLDEHVAWLARREVRAGDYAAVVLRFATDGYRATTPAGTLIDVTALSDELRAEFAAPVTAAGQPYARIELDLDLPASLLGDVASGTLTLDPMGTAEADDGAIPVALESRLALVLQRNTGTRELMLRLFADEQLATPIAPGSSIKATVTNDALLVTQLNFVENSVPFYFTYLTPGASIVDLHGTLGANGAFEVTCIELEDQNGVVTTPRFPLKVEGRIVEVTSPYVFKLQLRSIRRGEAQLKISGSPTLNVVISPQTGLFFDGLTLVPSSTLVAGLDVALKSEQISLSPLFATRVSIAELLPSFTGVITDISGLPQTFEMRLPAGHAAILSGQVDSELTDVLVQRASTPFVLATTTGHPISEADVRVGLTIDIAGTISGPATAPIVQATRLNIRPGRLIDATANFSANTDFLLDGGVIAEAFGPNLVMGGGGLFEVELEPGAVFRGAATSASEFQILVASGTPFLVDLLGLESGIPSRIRGFEVLSVLQN